MLKDIGAQLHHHRPSERRTYHKESDGQSRKFAVKNGACPVRNASVRAELKASQRSKTRRVCARQIDAVLKTQGAAAFRRCGYRLRTCMGNPVLANLQLQLQARAVPQIHPDHIAKVDLTSR